MTQHCVLIVEDDLDLSEAIEDTLKLAEFDSIVAKDAEQALSIIKRQNIQVVISDINMPGISGHELLRQIKRYQSDIPVILITAFSNVEGAVQAIQDGASDYIQKPFDPNLIVERVKNLIELRIHDETNPIQEDGSSKRVFSIAKKVAQTDASVMITGESGTGKEVLARFIHHHSDRKDHNFVAINCAAIPENMLEAILFGYEKGAFTGAYQSCPGKFEQANGGTLLLDEVSEMDLNLQAKILRVLQEKEVERLGGKKTIQLDVRIISTSNRDITSYIKDNKFREDLYYRLNVFPLKWHPLKDRAKDIIPLSERLIKQHNKNDKLPSLTEEARDKLIQHSWPGNIRELDNVIQRALILSIGDQIESCDIQLDSEWQPSPENSNEDSSQEKLSSEMKHHEFDIILKSLEKHNGVRKKVSEELGISSRTLRYKLAKMRDSGIEIPEKHLENTTMED